MEKDTNLRGTIYSFFKNKIPRNLQLHFQHWLINKERDEEKVEALNQLWSEIDVSADESTYKDLKEIHRRIKYLNRKTKSGYISFLRKVAILLLPILTFSAAYFYLKNSVSDTEIVQYYVPLGETKHVMLSDGTEVWINSESYLSVPKKFSSVTRSVNLIGEAYFQVAKDKKKPFIVQTNDMLIEVLGTKFNINAYPDLSEVKTTLKEGVVKVDINTEKKSDSFILSPNEELSLNTKTGEIIKRATDTSGLPAWDNGNMEFNAAIISDVFKQIERKYKIRITYDSKYNSKRLTVKFQNNESINEVFEILQLIVPELKINKQDSIVFIK